ncbi:MAG: radical SAM protein [Myxococcota bacterium]|nr:radical SAM protein [Myxococcota bacterium]
MSTNRSQRRNLDEMLHREEIANRKKHWVRAVTACNSKCLFCLDADTPRNVYLDEEVVKADLRKGIEEKGADKVIISGGEASLHPLFPEFIRYAKEIGYDRVQTVTNGTQYANKAFYERCVQAGLGEITYSLHGHTPKLHDYLTQTPGCFNKLMKALIRSVRDRRMITSVDVVINKQNVGVLDKIVELAISVGVTEFDLLHVIPQSNAYRNRDEMFYDVREYLPILQKVFRLNRHPRFYVWTNRFPVSYLEGLEDLIQDPHKMLDEVNGRRFQVRRYLDEGKALDCREPDRCQHCFIEPFCNTVDNTVEAQHEGRFDTWWVADVEAAKAAVSTLPFGCTRVGFPIESAEQLGDHDALLDAAMVVRPSDAGLPPETLTGPIVLVAHSAEQLESWMPVAGLSLRIELNRDTAEWMKQHKSDVAARMHDLHIHQPSHEKMLAAVERDVRDPVTFFEALNLPVRVSGLPACMAPGATLVDDPADLPAHLFDEATGRLDIRPLARHHIASKYRGKSVRCADCRVTDRCEGIHINMVRDQGLRQAQPLIEGAWADEAERQLTARWPEPPVRVHHGRNAQPASPSLPGFAQPDAAPADPLAVIAREVAQKAAARKAKRAAMRKKLEAGS